MGAKLIECVHGMLWQACNLCQAKTEEDVVAELESQQAANKEVKYDYQDLRQDDSSNEADLAFDIEDADY